MLDIYLDAQRAILGCLIIDPKFCADEIFGKVKSHLFSDANYRSIFERAHELYREGVIDRLVLQHKTPEYRRLITEIVDVTPTAANFREYIKVIHDEYKLYRADELREKLPELIRQGDIPAVGQALDEVKKIFENTGSGKSFSSMEELFMQFADEMDRKAEYIRFGFKSLDGKLYVEKGDYVVIGARPSIGKTALGLNIAHTMAGKYKTVFFSLETSQNKLISRYLANVLDLDFTKVKNKMLSDEEKGRMFDEYTRLKDLKVHLEERHAVTAQELCAEALMENAEVMIIDYLGLIEKDDRRRSDYESVSAISKYLHMFAQKHKVLVVVLCQLNREAAKGDKPSLAHLRDSGQIEQDADVIMLLHKPKEDDNMRELIIAKNKEGETGSVSLDFDGKHQRFFESQRASDIYKELRKIAKKAKKMTAAERVFGPTMTEVTDPDEIKAAQQALPM